MGVWSAGETQQELRSPHLSAGAGSSGLRFVRCRTNTPLIVSGAWCARNAGGTALLSTSVWMNSVPVLVYTGTIQLGSFQECIIIRNVQLHVLRTIPGIPLYMFASSISHVQEIMVWLVADERVAAHTSPWPHIEKASRAEAALAHLHHAGLISRCTLLAGRLASDEELLTVHSQPHIDEVKRLSLEAQAHPDDRNLREPDGAGGIYYSGQAHMAARAASGCVTLAARTVLEARTETARPLAAFAIVRPPGHHAGADDTPGHRAEGFCFFNSVAVAAGTALHTGAADRICIVDWDVHHGNGTQRIFYDDPRVLFISLHRGYDGQRWRYPGPNPTNAHCGAIEEVGGEAALGRTVNVAWPDGNGGDADYVATFELVVLPLLRAYKPDLIIVSSGFDAADGDVQVGRGLASHEPCHLL